MSSTLPPLAGSGERASRLARLRKQARLHGLVVAVGALLTAVQPFLAPEGVAARLGGAGAAGAAGFLLLVGALVAWVYPARPAPGPWYVLAGMQVAGAAALVRATGGVDGPGGLLLVLVVALSGLQQSAWGGVAMGSLAGVLWLLIDLLGPSAHQGFGAVALAGLSMPLFGTLGFLVGSGPGSEALPGTGEQSRRLEEAYATARQQAQERERRELELYDKQRKLAALMHLSRQLSSVRHPDELLALIVRSARDEMNSGIAMVLQLQGQELRVVHSSGLSQFSIEGLRERVGTGLFGRMVVSGENCRLGDAEGEAWRENLKALREPIRTLLAVPLQSPQDKMPFGILAVANALVGGAFQPEQEDYLKLLATDAAIAIKNINLYAELERSYYEIILALAQAIEAKDPYTHGHVARVRTYAVRLSRALQLPSEEVELISKAAILHDVGKISIPDGILMKPGALTDEEFDIMKTHAENALHILKDIRSLPPRIIDMVIHHHERHDGRGYPHGLKGEEIPLGAQIIGIADTFDAMTSDRCYRKGFSPEEALSRMEAASGTQFNPRLLKAFIGLFEFRARKNLTLDIPGRKEAG